MKGSELKTLVVLSHSAVIIALIIPLLILSGSFGGGQVSKDPTSEVPSTTLVDTRIKPLTF
jgi:hypothetical protein